MDTTYVERGYDSYRGQPKPTLFVKPAAIMTLPV